MAAFIAAFTLILAQEGVPEAPAAEGIDWSQYATIFYILLFIVVFYFLLIRPGQKQRKVHQQLVESIKNGDEVMTAGGIYGKVTGTGDDHIMLEIADDVEIKVSRNSVARRESAELALEEEKGETPEPPAES